MTSEVETIDTKDGLRIAFRSWRPAMQPRGIVVIVPGFNSHGGYYHWVAEQFMSDALFVHAIDLRGRGRSDGDRFFVQSFDDYVDDVTQLIALAKAREPSLPMILLGHSAGGVVACLYALKHQAELAGLISESFAFELPAPDFALAAIRGLSHLAPHAHVLRLKNEDFSRDPEVVRTMNEDPLIAHEAQPTQTLAALVRADQELRKGFAQITLPVLILHGTADKAARPSGSQHFFDALGSEQKTLKLYDGGFHDPLNDVDRERVIRDIRDWIAHLLPPHSLSLGKPERPGHLE